MVALNLLEAFWLYFLTLRLQVTICDEPEGAPCARYRFDLGSISLCCGVLALEGVHQKTTRLRTRLYQAEQKPSLLRPLSGDPFALGGDSILYDHFFEPAARRRTPNPGN
jgi:hypothetical protein